MRPLRVWRWLACWWWRCQVCPTSGLHGSWASAMDAGHQHLRDHSDHPC